MRTAPTPERTPEEHPAAMNAASDVTPPAPAAFDRTLLITAGPTFEPIDSVRYLGNRSSGRMGVALADEAARRGWVVRLLLGPVAVQPTDARVQVDRFRTVSDLQALLRLHAPACRVLIMAAAVSDFRPKPNPAMSGGKFRRTSDNFTLELEPTPDLLAEVGSNRRPGQLLVGFALEPRAELLASARAKIERKKIDLCVANPLETMDSRDVEALLVFRDGAVEQPEGKLPKTDFAAWLLRRLESLIPA